MGELCLFKPWINRMQVYWINPLLDARWPGFVDNHPRSSVFHTRGWLAALEQTYGFRPLALTTSPPDSPLADGIVFCFIDSWLTGRRYICLPFSDHCEPLLSAGGELEHLARELRETLRREGLKYIELRPLSSLEIEGFVPDRQYKLHKLDLRRNLGELRAGLHKDCIQRKIRRAEQSALQYEEGRGYSQLERFYHLQTLTRRRLRVPPQPISWFRNLADRLGDRLTIRIAALDTRPIAAILTVCHKNAVTYKYGCSDEHFHRLGATQMLLWRAIQDAKAAGAVEFDLGRTDIDNPGLIAFKDRWGAAQSTLTYYRFAASPAAAQRKGMNFVQRTSPLLPGWILAQAGRRLYGHFA